VIERLINRPCVLERDPESEEAEERDDWAEPSEAPDLGSPIQVETVCELQQRRREEPGEHGEMSDTDWVAYFKPDEDVSTASRLIVDDEVYEFVGDPERKRDPFTRRFSHIEASLRRAQ
jgi:hypothetical protein